MTFKTGDLCWISSASDGHPVVSCTVSQEVSDGEYLLTSEDGAKSYYRYLDEMYSTQEQALSDLGRRLQRSKRIIEMEIAVHRDRLIERKAYLERVQSILASLARFNKDPV